MLRPISQWLAQTPVSKILQDTPWVVPTSQSIHIFAIAIVFTSVCMINLRLLGVWRRGRSTSELVIALIPWMWRGLAVLAVTGLVQTITEPARQFGTPAFWAKMAMIVVVLVMTVGFARAVRRRAEDWDRPSARRYYPKVFAVVSTLLWLAIIACGRFIGYTWSAYS